MSHGKGPTLADIHALFDSVARQSKETDRKIAEVGQEVAKVTRQVGELTNGWGRFVEALVAPAIPREFGARGFRIDGVSQRFRKELHGKHIEIDVLAVGRDRQKKKVVIATEVRSHLQSEGAVRFVEKLGSFFRFFPEYEGYALLGAVAGIRIDEGTPDRAVELGLYVLVPSGETVHLAVPRRFEPRVWRASGRS